MMIFTGSFKNICSLYRGSTVFNFVGIHPTTISESFQKALDKALNILTEMSTPLMLSDRESLLKSATTSLCSKVL